MTKRETTRRGRGRGRGGGVEGDEEEEEEAEGSRGCGVWVIESGLEHWYQKGYYRIETFINAYYMNLLA